MFLGASLQLLGVVWIAYLHFITADDLPTCLPQDFHYEFTDCDDRGGRWRVSVPTPGKCTGGAPNAPIRVENCNMACDTGYYYNLTQLECEECPTGTYSLGGGILFDNWDDMPNGFHVTTESFQSSFRSLARWTDDGETDCSSYAWKPHGEFIASAGGPCSSTLAYTVKLVKPGNLVYTYQYIEDSIIFQFQAQNDQCLSIEEAEQSRWPTVTGEGKWATMKVPLNTGLNVLQWKTIGFSLGSDKRSKPVLIRNIQISGVAYTSACTPCMNGTYSAVEGSSFCEECPMNTYSTKGMNDCNKCLDSEFSYRGSANCKPRQPCTEQDYYAIRSPCYEDNKTLVTYQWNEPKICSDTSPTSVQLPSPAKIQCPPCNPGMQYLNTSGCSYCPRNHFSDGLKSCEPCPASTAPNYGYNFLWWNEMPPGMESTCLLVSTDGLGCRTVNGWQAAGDHIHSGLGHADGVYLVLSLKVPGFKTHDANLYVQSGEVSRIEFTFELNCAANCEFVFMQAGSRGVVVVQSWTGMQPKQKFTYKITQNDSYTFSWAFQKVQWDRAIPKLNPTSRSLDSDVAKIFSVNVTNTIDGGAGNCLPCPQGTQKDGCIPCPSSHYVDKNTSKCVQCPLNTFVSDYLAYGQESCKSCGPGLRNDNGQTCYSDCTFEEDGHFYDFSTLSGFHLVKGSQLFTSSGTQYFHVFNVSLCGTMGLPQTACYNNVSSGGLPGNDIIKSMICRSTLVPLTRLDSGSTSYLSAQSVSLGDTLVGISLKPSLEHINVTPAFLSERTTQNDVYFFYTSPIVTRACLHGRTTTLTLRCDATQVGNGTIQLPPQCPDGTCDGCSFHFLWLTRFACPTCTANDYEVVKGDCVNGIQKVHHIAPNHCLLDIELEGELQQKCSVIPRELQLIIGLAALLGILLIALVCYFWKKNRKLEYNYMKLVQSSSAKDGELPPAESCALNDDEEDHFDSVQFKESKSKKFFGKIKLMAGSAKGEGENPFQTIQLTERENTA